MTLKYKVTMVTMLCWFTLNSKVILLYCYLLLFVIISGVNNEMYLFGGSGYPGHLPLAPPSWLYDGAIM